MPTQIEKSRQSARLFCVSAADNDAETPTAWAQIRDKSESVIVKKFFPAALSVLLIPSLLFTFHFAAPSQHSGSVKGAKKSSALMAEGVGKSPKMGYIE